MTSLWILDAQCFSDSILWNHSCPSVYQSVHHLILNQLIFSDIVHDDSWPWYLVKDGTRLLKKKKIGGLNLGSSGLHWAQNEVFGNFLDCGSLVFLESAYNDSLQQCLTSSRGKTHKKVFGTLILAKVGLEN